MYKKNPITPVLVFFLYFSISQHVVCQETNFADNLDIPVSYGTITDRYNGSSDKPAVVYIQDIHTSYAAQKNITHILDFLISTHGINLVGTEGATGAIITDELTSFPDIDVREPVAEYFFRNGLIDGAEYLAIVGENDTTNKNLSLFGVEDPDLYKVNLNSFKCVKQYDEQLQAYISFLTESVAVMQSKTYSPELIELMELTEPFHHNEVDFLTYCKQIFNAAKIYTVSYETYENLTKMFQLLDMENSLDMSRVDVERAFLLGALKHVVPVTVARELMEKEIKYKLHAVSDSEYMLYLKKLIEFYHVEYEEYVTLNQFFTYVELFSTINKKTILEECMMLERSIYDLLIKTGDQQFTYDISNYTALLKKCAGLQVSPEMFVQFRKYYTKYSYDKIADGIRRIAAMQFDNSGFDESILEHFGTFYSIAHQRESALAARMLDLLKEKHQSRGVLIAGGYHVDGVTEYLKQHDVSYIVVAPSGDENAEEIPYLSLLSDFRTPLDKFIEAYTGTLKVASWLAAEPLAYHPDRRLVLSVKIKTLFASTKLYNMYAAKRKGVIADYEALGNELCSTINRIIHMTGYDSIMHISSVSATDHDIVAQLVFPKNVEKTILVVRCSTNDTSFYFDRAIAKDILEVIELSTGVTEQFLDYPAYLSCHLKDYLCKRLILESLEYRKLTFDSLYKELANKFSTMNLSREDAYYILSKLINDGIIEQIQDTDITRYALMKHPSIKLFMELLKSSEISDTEIENPLETKMLSVSRTALDDSILINYPIFNRVSAIMIEPSLSLKSMYEIVQELYGKEEVVLPENLPVEMFHISDATHKCEKICFLKKELGRDLSLEDTLHLNAIKKRLPKGHEIISIGRYFNIHPLTTSEDDLWQLVAGGDAQSEKELVEKYDYVAQAVARKMNFLLLHSKYHSSTMEFEDLLGVAHQALLNSVRHFDPDRGVPFAGYASIAVRNEIKRQFAASKWIKASVSTQIRVLYSAEGEFEKKYERKPTDEELADFMNTSVQKIERLKELSSNRILSLDQPITSDPDSSSLEAFIPSKATGTPEELLLEKERKQFLRDALLYLTSREREIVTLRYLQEMTLEQIGEIEGVSRSRIQQIEAQATEKMTNIMALSLRLGQYNLRKLKNHTARIVDELNPRDREIIMLSFAGSVTDEEIEARINYSTMYMRMYRNEIIAFITKKVLAMGADEKEKAIWTEYLDDTIRQILYNIIEDRDMYMIDMLEDMVFKSYDISLDAKQVRDVLENYKAILSPLEEEAMMLFYYEGKNTMEIAEIVDYPQQKIVFIMQSARNKIKNYLDLIQFVSQEKRDQLAQATLKAVNNLPLMDRGIILGGLYDGKSRSDLGEEYGFTPSGIGVRKWINLSILQSELFDAVDFVVKYDSDIDLLATNSLKKFEPLLQGLLFEIPRSAFSTEEITRPETILEVLEWIVKNKMSYDIEQETLSQLLQWYIPFINERDKEVLMLRYSSGMTLGEVSQATGITVETLSPQIYRKIFPALDFYLTFYNTVEQHGFAKIFSSMSKIMEELYPKERFMLVYRGYDFLTDDQIADLLEIEKTNDNHHKKFIIALRHLREPLLAKLDNPDIENILITNRFALQYLLHWMQLVQPRGRFHVPEVPVTEEESSQVTDNDQYDHYDLEFLNNLYAWLKPDSHPTEIQLRELSALLDTLSEQQFFTLYYRYGENITVRKTIAEKVGVTEVTLNSVMKTMKRKLKQRLDELEQFQPEERSKLRHQLADCINHLLIPVEYKTMLIYLYYDAIGNKETAELLQFENPSNSPHQKTIVIKKLQKAFANRLDSDEFQSYFSGSTNNIMEFLFSLKAEIPREYFGIEESPVGRKRADLKYVTQEDEVDDSKIDDSESSEAGSETRSLVQYYSLGTVYNLFEQFSYESIEDLKRYLDYFAQSPNSAVIPHPLIINRNQIFRAIRKYGEEPESIANAYDLSPYYGELLRYVMEKSGFMAVDVAEDDVILVDIDTLEVPKVIPAYNSRARRELAASVRNALYAYRNNARGVHFVFFSKRYTMSQIEAILGNKLFASLRRTESQFYSREMLGMLGKHSTGDAYRQLYFDLRMQYSISRVNFKLFSTDPVVQKVGKEFGLIQASPEENIFSALDLLSNIHPDQSVNWWIYNSELTVADIVDERSQGYYSLSGVVLSRPQKREEPKPRALSTNHYLDTAL